jgi:AAHS family 4-hydroxybenzoate transporter-like MFS transporter
MAGASPIDVPSWIDRQKVSPLQIAIACVCGAAVMLDGFDAQIIGFVAPTLIEEFKIAPAALATTFSAGLFGILAGCLVLAPLADWVGRRWIIIVSVAIFAVATLLTARIDTLQELTILRFITGVGLGACMPNALALTSEYAPALYAAH